VGTHRVEDGGLLKDVEVNYETVLKEASKNESSTRHKIGTYQVEGNSIGSFCTTG
jgi:hypothetical protein